MQVTPHEHDGDAMFWYVAFFVVEYMAVTGFQCVGTGWNSVRLSNSCLDQKMSPEPPSTQRWALNV